MKSMLGSKLSGEVILGYFVVKNYLVCKGAVFYMGVYGYMGELYVGI